MTFIPATLEGQSIPPLDWRPLATGEEFEKGALLALDSAGAYVEVDADPTAVSAVASMGAGADASGFVRTGRKEFPPGEMGATPIREARMFHAEYVGTLPAAPGGSYGVVRGADGKWRVDFSETTALVVKYVRTWTESPINRNRVFVVFLPAVIASVD